MLIVLKISYIIGVVGLVFVIVLYIVFLLILWVFICGFSIGFVWVLNFKMWIELFCGVEFINVDCMVDYDKVIKIMNIIIFIFVILVVYVVV